MKLNGELHTYRQIRVRQQLEHFESRCLVKVCRPNILIVLQLMTCTA